MNQQTGIHYSPVKSAASSQSSLSTHSGVPSNASPAQFHDNPTFVPVSQPVLASNVFPQGMRRNVGGSSPNVNHDGDVAIELQPAQLRRRGAANSDNQSQLDPALFDQEYEVQGKRVRLMPVRNEGPCGTFAGIQTVMMAILALQIILLLIIVVGGCVSYFYIYPTLVDLMDDKIKNVGELAINLAEENSKPVVDMVECIISSVGESVNSALGPLLGVDIDFSPGNKTLAERCPLSFAGINHTVGSSTMSEVLGSSFDTQAPSFRSQLHVLKYGETHGSSVSHSTHHSGGSYASVYYLSDTESSPSSATDGD